MKFYAVTDHAIDEAVAKLGIKRENAKAMIQDRMQVARYQGEDGNGRIFDHYKSRTRMILAKDKDVVITVYSMDSAKPPKWYDVEKFSKNVIIAKARFTIEREIAKARRQFSKEFRQLSESQALVQIEIAQLTLNKARAKNPKTQASIQANIDAALGLFDEYGVALSELQSEFERTKREADAFLTV